MKRPLFPRAIERLLDQELLVAFPAVMLVGPRGCGKSTSMAQFADTVLDLSDPSTRFSAAEDPDGILRTSKGRVLVDEWQECPEILGAIKRAIDQDHSGATGRFLITGSARAAHQAATWPGTGRFIRLRMFGLTQAEIMRDASYNPIDEFFSPTVPQFNQSSILREDYFDRIVAGRFPEAIGFGQRNRSLWYRSYTEQLVERDTQQVAERNTKARKIRAVLNSCAARTGQVLNKKALSTDAEIDFRTADYVAGLLEDLSIILRVPAWHVNPIKRLTKSPKVCLVDSGMACNQLGLTAETLSRSPGLTGQLFESFVYSELATHKETAAEVTDLYHLRTEKGLEIDVILERSNRVVALEVKSSNSAHSRDAKNLLWLRDQIGDRFHMGVVLYSGAHPFQIDERIWALPISSLWQL
ncbi:MAG: ATP-binding protein [Planctomycetes bacterium]|nr:ATP-binding protein [Planctomycetota bacterium]